MWNISELIHLVVIFYLFFQKLFCRQVSSINFDNTLLSFTKANPWPKPCQTQMAIAYNYITCFLKASFIFNSCIQLWFILVHIFFTSVLEKEETEKNLPIFSIYQQMAVVPWTLIDLWMYFKMISSWSTKS